MLALSPPLIVLALACSPASPPAQPAPTETGVGHTGAPPLPACVHEDFELEPGIGPDETFVPLHDGDEVEIVKGPQGGWHIELAGRVEGTGSILLVDATVVVVDGQVQIAGDQVPTIDHPADWDPDTCAATFFEHPAFVDDHEPTDQAFVCGLEGAEADLTLEVTDPATEAVQTASRRLLLTLSPEEQAVCQGL